MGWNQVIAYEEIQETLPPPVRKHVWDGQEFVPITLYRAKGIPDLIQMQWLVETFGVAGIYKNGSYWDMSRAGDFTIMDEKVYIWYQMKWVKK